MTYRTRQILRTTLPISIWLLAVVGIYCFYRFSPNPRWEGAIGLFFIYPLYRHAAAQHADCIRQSYLTALIMGIASYWIPTVLLLTPIVWWLITNYYEFQFRDVLAFLLGFATVGIYATLLIYLGWCTNRWACFFCPFLLWGWIPVFLTFLGIFGTKTIKNALKMR